MSEHLEKNERDLLFFLMFAKPRGGEGLQRFANSRFFALSLQQSVIIAGANDRWETYERYIICIIDTLYFMQCKMYDVSTIYDVRCTMYDV